MAGIEDVAVGHGQFFPLVFPSFGFHLRNGADRTIGQDALRAEGDRCHVGGLLSVPTLKGADAATISHKQHIVAKAACQLFIVGIELAFLQFHAFVELAVGVKSLFFIEVNAIAYELGFEHGAVAVYHAIEICRARHGDGLYGCVAVVLGVACQHLSEYAGGVLFGWFG